MVVKMKKIILKRILISLVLIGSVIAIWIIAGGVCAVMEALILSGVCLLFLLKATAEQEDNSLFNMITFDPIFKDMKHNIFHRGNK